MIPIIGQTVKWAAGELFCSIRVLGVEFDNRVCDVQVETPTSRHRCSLTWAEWHDLALSGKRQ